MKLLRLRNVIETTGLSKSSIYAMMAEDRFPRQVKIGVKAVAWRQDEIAKWVDDRCYDRG